MGCRRTPLGASAEPNQRKGTFCSLGPAADGRVRENAGKGGSGVRLEASLEGRSLGLVSEGHGRGPANSRGMRPVDPSKSVWQYAAQHAILWTVIRRCLWMETHMVATGQDTRLDVRLAKDSKKLIEQAAGILGQTVSAFTVATLVREAEEVVERFGMLRLSNRDRDAFLGALDNPPEPNARLRKAARLHAKKVAQ